MYIIGINFGYKETTGSFYDTESRCGVVGRLHILDGDTSEACKVESAVWRNRETGEWQFVRDMRDYYLPCLLYTSPSPRDRCLSRMPSSA